MTSTLRNTLLASLIAGLGFAATAQTAPAAPAMKEHGAMGHGGMDPAKMQEMMAKKHAEHLADLKTLLRVTPAQEGAWTTFTGSMTPPAHAMHSAEERAKMHAEMEKLTTPERMEKMRAMHAERHAKRSAEMDKRIAAVKTFYAVLSPEQKKVFDVAHKRMMKDHMGHKPHGEHHG